MLPKLKKLTSILLCFLLVLQQAGFSQTIDLSGHFSQLSRRLSSDKFRPLHLRCISYNAQEDNFRLRLDKSNLKNPSLKELEDWSKTLFNYFLIGLSLPNDAFWVNLRPDSPDNIIDDSLARTDMGKIMLETDLQLKKDTAQSTSPNTPEGKAYWDKLYQKAEELYGNANITIPTLTRPWIVPGEIIIGETIDSAYVYKATLKVMLEEDYLKNSTNSINSSNSTNYSFNDPRLKELNQYSTQLIRETIIPKLTYEVNTSKRYAPLRQVYYSLILAQWFKARYRKQSTVNSKQFTVKDNDYIKLIDSGGLTSNFQLLTIKQPYSKEFYFQQYQESFAQGEYNLKKPVHAPSGQTIRSYFSGGEQLNVEIHPWGTNRAGSPITIIPSNTLPSSPTETGWINTATPTAASSLIDINLSPAKTKELADALTEKLGLPSPTDLIDKFTVSGKTFEFWSNNNMTCFIIGPLMLLPLIDKDLLDPGKSKHALDGLDLRSMVEAIKDKLIKTTGELYLKNSSNILLVSPFSAVPGHPINPYSALMIAGMLAAANSFKGATIVDAGSGAGLLSLVALGLGAENAVLIENNDIELQLARAILEAQEYKKDEKFIRVKESLGIKTKALIEILKKTSGLDLSPQRLIGLANIGPWEWYGKANHKAIELFIELGVSKIINGGYSFNFKTHKDNLPHREEFNKIISLLKNANYNTEQYPLYNPKLPIPAGYGLITAKIEIAQSLVNENQNIPVDKNPLPRLLSAGLTFVTCLS